MRISLSSSSRFVSSTAMLWNSGLISDRDFLSLLTEAAMVSNTSPQCFEILSAVEQLISQLLNDPQTSTKMSQMYARRSLELRRLAQMDQNM
jgi:hypothetical protein